MCMFASCTHACTYVQEGKVLLQMYQDSGCWKPKYLLINYTQYHFILTNGERMDLR